MYSAISANKRNTIFIMGGFMVLITGLGWIASYWFQNVSILYIVFGIALIYALIQYFAAGSLAVSMTGAREIEKADAPHYYRIVENLAITLGIPTPRIYIIDDPAPNAFATGRDPKHAIVAATSGLLDIMDDRQLEAVMAHEMGHVKNYDIRVSMIVFGLVSAVGILTDIILRMFIFGDDRDNESNPLAIILGIIMVILAPLVALLIQMAISRQREYLADASSALTTRDPEGMIQALEKLQQYSRPLQAPVSSASHLFIVNPLKPGFFASLFSTHPPLEERIERLQKNEDKF